MNDILGRNTRTWRLGNNRIQRIIAFEEGRGLRTTSFLNPVSGRDFAGSGPEPAEFLVLKYALTPLV